MGRPDHAHVARARRAGRCRGKYRGGRCMRSQMARWSQEKASPQYRDCLRNGPQRTHGPGGANVGADERDHVRHAGWPAVGVLAGSLVSGTDVGLPLVPSHGVAMLPANIATFAEGLEVDLGEVRLYLAVREAARVRLFAEVAWLGPQLVAAVQAYAVISASTPRASSPRCAR